VKQTSLFDAQPQEHPDETGETLVLPAQEERRDEQVCAASIGGAREFPFRELSFDVEATGKDPFSDRLVGIALCKERGKAFYVPVRHVGGPNVEEALALLKAPLESESVAKIGHNLKYDILMVRNEGIRVQGVLYDTMLASYLLNPNKPNHSLQDVALERLGHKKQPFAEVLGGRHSFSEVPVEEATRYAAEDAALAMELKEILFTRLHEEHLLDLYMTLEMPLVYVLAGMEEAGVRIREEGLRSLSKELEREIDVLQSRIYALAGVEFNINSPRQLGKILFERLGLKPTKKTKTGFSTGMEILEELAKGHDLPGEILAYRTLYKLKTTYMDTLPRLVNETTGRIHTSFNQTATATGRLSSSDPNLQNIPIRGEWGRKIREVFVADAGCVLLSADYSQIELRILAHVSGDEVLLDAFTRGIDIHTRTASEIFGVPEESVTPDMRRIAKTVNFGVIYGISPFGLSEALGIPQKDAALYIEQYFTSHGGVKRYIEDVLASARDKGYVTTLLGRKRPIPEIRSGNVMARQQAERIAMNTPIQGAAADLIKLAMIRIWKRLRERSLKTRMVLQIHDELVFEAPEEEVDEVKALVAGEMEQALPLSVPIKVEIGAGNNWAEAH
jgi:DNA polymerase-1